MKSDRWRIVSPHLDQVLELPAEERRRYLDDLAREDPALAADLELLLAEERALREEKYLEHDAQDLLADSHLVGQVFGAYELVAPLGAGGMGSVWLARRNDGRFEGTAAVKLLSAALLGAEGAARFRREGTILARLKHPHIAQLIDAGVSAAGQPYLVLEYVEGEPIDRWCDNRTLDVASRLRLFLDVLAAVAYAHSQLVVHRDLKPSNVMVSKDGRVKLLDFGIAKLLEGDDGDGGPTALTRAAGSAFTPAFAAPEQILGERVTTATDVYALGALLYLLLTGRHPAGNPGTPPAALVRAILETDPDRPSEAVHGPRTAPSEAHLLAAAQRVRTPERLRRELRGDLDTIVAKALKKRPEERYWSVGALAEDLRRYLAAEPIHARPDSLAYRARKFTRRHARSLAAAAAAVLALVAVVAFYGTRLAHERDRARREAQKAAQVSEFLTDLLTHADPFEAAGPRDPTVSSLLDLGTARVRKDLAAQPELQREMLTLLGRIYERRGAYEKALPLLTDAVALGRRTLGPGPSRELAESLHDLGVAQGQKAQWDAARAALAEALVMRRQLLGPAHPDVAVSESELGRVLFDQGRLDEAEVHLRAALAIRRQVLGPFDHETAVSLSDLGLLLRDKGDRAGAEALLREALEVTRRSRGPRHPDVASALNNLALIINARGDYRAAEAMYREAVAIGQASLGKDHPENAQCLTNLAGVLRAEGKLAEAEARAEEALVISRPALGPDHPAVSRQEVSLARIYLDEGRLAAAQALLLHALAVQQRSYDASDWRLGITESFLGVVYTRLSRFAEAEPHLLRASELLPVKPGTEGTEAREARANRERLVALYEAWGRSAQAALYRSPPDGAGPPR